LSEDRLSMSSRARSAAAVFDVVVVGARCAGAPLAAMLARAGLRVCLLDKDRFPSDTLSTHAIQPIGVTILERLGVLDELLARAPALTAGRMVFDDGDILFPEVVGLLGAPVMSVRRVVLDEVLVRMAGEADVDVRTGSRATGLVTEDGRVVGVVTPQGEVRAALVVGADGTRSDLARMVGAREYHRTTNGRVFMWDYYEGDPTDAQSWIGKIGDHAYLVTPTDSGLTLVAACPSIDRRAEVRADRDRVYEDGVRAWPELHQRLGGMRRTGPVHTMANLNGFFRQASGPGWVLVGDAGHFKDPTPGQGIADALRQAERLSDAIATGFDAGDLDGALRDWWRWRDDDAWEMYWLAHDLGAAGPTPPLLAHALRRIAANPALAAGVLRIFNHDIRPSEVFTPAFVAATLRSALRERRGERRAILREASQNIRNEIRRRRARRQTVASPS
jgi:menaquinone-9 beta-reductase